MPKLQRSISFTRILSIHPVVFDFNSSPTTNAMKDLSGLSDLKIACMAIETCWNSFFDIIEIYDDNI